MAALLFLFAGCGDCSEDAIGDGAGLDDGGADGEATTPADGEGADDGTTGDAMSPIDGAGGCSKGQRFCDGSCADVRRNQVHCGACGNSCSGKEICTEGSCVCPRYYERCNGSCVPTQIDPDNCGSCGNSCGSNQVCSAGGCAEECQPEREACARKCVDTSTDPDNCGGCGNSCGEGKGCLSGGCEEAIDVGVAPDKCAGGGPQIDVESRKDGRKRCLGNVAQNVFRWAICSCDKLVSDNEIRTDAYDSTIGRYQPGGLGASVGTNDKIEVGNRTDVRGSVWASGSGGASLDAASFDNDVLVHQQLHVGGNAVFGKIAEIRKDGYVAQDIEAGDSVEFQEVLHVNSQSSVPDEVSYKQLDRTVVNVDEACGRCGVADRIPVDAIVSAHSGTNNDNGLINLDADILSSQGDNVVLVLPCGEYYLSEIAIENEATILAEGRTALYIGGDVDVGNDLTIKAAPGGELDVFVAGNVTIDDKAVVGDPVYPASTRFYVGGQGGWHIENDARIGAYIYSIPGGVSTDNDLEVFGGLYTQNLDAGNNVDIHYDRGVLDAGENCTSDPPDSPNGDGDAGMGDTSQPGDGGGGTTPACAESGESCASDGDCCAPLVCGKAGTCDVKSCRALGESCSDDSDCCTGTCASAGGESSCVGA